MAAPSWIKRLTDDDQSRDLDPAPLSKYSTPRGSFSELSQGTGSTRYLDAPVNETKPDRGQSNYGFYSESKTQELPKRYLSPATASRQRDHVMYMGQGRARRNLNSRYEVGFSQEDLRLERTRRASGEPRREQSWAYIDNSPSGEVQAPVHRSTSYGDFEGTTSSATSSSMFNIPRIRTDIYSTSSSTHTLEDPRKHRKTRETSSDETGTSGYSTNSISELSEFSSAYRSDKGKLQVPKSGGKRRQSSDEKGSKSSTDRVSDRDRGSKSSTERLSDRDRGSKCSTERLSDRDSKHSDRKLNKRRESNLSVNDSVTSLSSSREQTRKAKETGKSVDSKLSSEITQKAPTIGNVAVTVTNNIQYDPNDPFSFIQPVDLPFHVKVRKCMGPILAVILLLIVAVSLGAAIYFAAALKETQENQIELLKATLAMKIRNVDYHQDIDHLSSKDFTFLSSKYCNQMDEFYSRSKFKDTYRGCEVIAIKNHYINFTLFFVEHESSQQDIESNIVNVIESSAPKVQKDSVNVAVVDKFELELDSLKVKKIERQSEPETFNKNTFTPAQTSDKDGRKNDRDKTTRRPTKPPPPPAPPKPAATQSPKVVETTKKAISEDGPIYSWRPCSKYEGTYFPHPISCDKFFQCTNGEAIEHQCTTGLIYHWKEFTCVSKFMPNVQCPDPAKAPPRPTTTTERPKKPTTAPTSQSTTSQTTTKSTTTQSISTTTKTIITGSLTALAGKFEGRPDYPADPCTNGENGKLYPHPDDCGKFIQCVNGKVQEMSCAPKLVFHPDNSQCMFPTNQELICPDIKPCEGKDHGYFPHPFDCSKFIQCQMTKEVVLTCQTGLVWDSGVNSCVHRTSNTVCPSR